MKSNHKLLNILIFAGLIAGTIVGFYLYYKYHNPELALSKDDITKELAWLKEMGGIVLMRPLKMLIIPLVFTSVVMGITSIGDPSRLGFLGGSTLVYYFSTMLIAVVVGAILVSTIKPGVMTADDQAQLLQYAADEGQPDKTKGVET